MCSVGSLPRSIRMHTPAFADLEADLEAEIEAEFLRVRPGL